MPQDTIYELVIRGHHGTDQAKFVTALHFLGIESSASASHLAADFVANAVTEYRGCLGAQAIVDRVEVWTLLPWHSDYGEQNVNLPGTSGSGTLATSLCAIITWRTGLPGRRKRGRTYLSPLYFNDTAAGAISNVWVINRGQPFAQKMLSRYGPNGVSSLYRFGVWSRLNGGGIPPTSLAGFQQVNSFTMQPNLGTMGSRRLGRD